MRRTAVGVVLAAAVLAVPAAATGAITVSISGGTLTIVGSDADEDVSIGSAGGNQFGPTTDVSGGGQDMVAGTGCQGFGAAGGPANDNSVFCPTNDFQRISVTLAGGEDEFTAGNALPMTVDAGADDDDVTTGPGPDVVLGGAGDDVLDLDANNASGTSSEVDGGDDDDELRIGRDVRATIVRGGGGRDTATYRFASGAKTVTIDNVANDGASGEGDDIRTDVEVVIGSSSGDNLTGSGAGETLDGAAGTDTLTGLAGPDTLIGGPGVNDATSGGPGEDSIMLRDGEVDACPDGGPDNDTFDLDLVDQVFTFRGGRLSLPRCIFPRIPGLQNFDIVLAGAVDEGPNVRMTVLSPAVSRTGVRVRLACPAALRKPCAGPLRVFTFRGRRALATVAYSVRPGRSEIVLLPLDPGERRAALAAPALRVISVEKGRSRLGPKTTLRLVRPRGS
jgi:RTX calcium-binding nonapeptide repeat (4 copies)